MLVSGCEESKVWWHNTIHGREIVPPHSIEIEYNKNHNDLKIDTSLQKIKVSITSNTHCHAIPSTKKLYLKCNGMNFGIKNGFVFAQNGKGIYLWKTPIAPHSHHSMLISRDEVLLSHDLELTKLNAHSGKKIWSLHLQDLPRYFVKHKGYIVLSTSSDAIYYIDDSNGHVTWKNDSYQSHESLYKEQPNIFIRNDIIVFVIENNAILGFDASNGSEEPSWIVSISSIFSDMNEIKSYNASENTLILISKHKTIGLNIEDGHISWTRNFGTITNVLQEGGFAYYINDHHQLICMQSASGKIQWFNNHVKSQSVHINKRKSCLQLSNQPKCIDLSSGNIEHHAIQRISIPRAK